MRAETEERRTNHCIITSFDAFRHRWSGNHISQLPPSYPISNNRHQSFWPGLSDDWHSWIIYSRLCRWGEWITLEGLNVPADDAQGTVFAECTSMAARPQTPMQDKIRSGRDKCRWYEGTSLHWWRSRVHIWHGVYRQRWLNWLCSHEFGIDTLWRRGLYM